MTNKEKNFLLFQLPSNSSWFIGDEASSEAFANITEMVPTVIKEMNAKTPAVIKENMLLFGLITDFMAHT